MVFKANEGTMRQDTSGSSGRAVVIGNRRASFISAAFVNGSTQLTWGMAAAIYRHNPTASWLIAPGSGIAAPARGIRGRMSRVPGDHGNDETPGLRQLCEGGRHGA